VKGNGGRYIGVGHDKSAPTEIPVILLQVIIAPRAILDHVLRKCIIEGLQAGAMNCAPTIWNIFYTDERKAINELALTVLFIYYSIVQTNFACEEQ
jgi:hypothetical protein